MNKPKTKQKLKAVVQFWWPTEPGYEIELESGNSDLLDKALSIYSGRDIEKGWKTSASCREINDSCQGHKLYRVEFYNSPPVFVGGGDTGFLTVGRHIWRHGKVAQYGDERSIVRGLLESADPITGMGKIKIINIDRIQPQGLLIEYSLKD